VTKQLLQERMEKLIKERQALIDNVNAYNGAIEDCNHWLKAEASETSSSTPDEKKE
jgi:predicted nuclease with TOPRIM domain